MDAREALLSVMSESELEKAIDKKIEKFHGFLTRDVATKLIATEKGLLKEEEKTVKINEIKPAEKRLIVEVEVAKVYPTAAYRSGKKSRRVRVKDGTGEMTLVLWNDDIDLAARMRSGDRLLLHGVYERNQELHLGYYGFIKVKERAGFSDMSTIDTKEGLRVHLRGFISRIAASGGGRFVFIVSDGKTEMECSITEGIERGNALAAGDEFIIENALVADGKVLLDNDTRILTRRRERMLLGKINDMECRDEKLEVVVGEEKVSLDRENALKFMGIKAADDIRLSTLVTLKKDKLINTNVSIKIARREGKIIVG
jgi:hypothetical protein